MRPIQGLCVSRHHSSALEASTACKSRNQLRYLGLSHWVPPARKEAIMIQTQVMIHSQIQARRSSFSGILHTATRLTAKKGSRAYHPAASRVLRVPQSQVDGLAIAAGRIG